MGAGIDQDDTRRRVIEAAPTGGPRLAMACTALAVSAVLLSGEPARAKVSHDATVQAVRWAGQPCVLVADGLVPAAVDNTLRLSFGTPAPMPVSPTHPTCETTRRACRTRIGGRYGP